MAIDPGMTGGRMPTRAPMYSSEKKQSAFADWLPFVLGALALLIVFVVAATLIRGRTTGRILGNGDFSAGTSGWIMTGQMQSQVVSVDDAPTSRALRLQVGATSTRNPWDLQLTQKSSKALPKGTKIHISFWARSPESLTMAAKYQRTGDADLIVFKSFDLTPKWKEYSMEGIVVRDYAANQTELTYHLAYGTGTFDITSVSAAMSRPKKP